MTVVSDTSTITNLLQVNQLLLLNQLYGSIVIPGEVYNELGRIDGQIVQLNRNDWIEIVQPTDERLISSFASEIDRGESEAIALALELNAEYLIIDELKGRAVAERMGLRIIGLLGILIDAKRKGLVEAVRPIIETIIANGFRLNTSLVEKVLAKLNE